MAETEDELVSVALIREDLRILLVAASNFLHDEREQGRNIPELERAIQRVGGTANAAQWQPKPKRPDEDSEEPG
jgi:hypothetical protein